MLELSLSGLRFFFWFFKNLWFTSYVSLSLCLSVPLFLFLSVSGDYELSNFCRCEMHFAKHTSWRKDNKCFVFQICRNGLLRFESSLLVHRPLELTPDFSLPNAAILAPYWSKTNVDSSFNKISKVYYHVYSKDDSNSAAVLKRATSDVKRFLTNPLPTNFKATWLIVVTWMNLKPAPEDKNEHWDSLVSCLKNSIWWSNSYEWTADKE